MRPTGFRPDLNVVHVASSFLCPPPTPLPVVLMYLTVATLPHIRYQCIGSGGRRFCKGEGDIHKYLTCHSGDSVGVGASRGYVHREGGRVVAREWEFSMTLQGNTDR